MCLLSTVVVKVDWCFVVLIMQYKSKLNRIIKPECIFIFQDFAVLSKAIKSSLSERHNNYRKYVWCMNMYYKHGKHLVLNNVCLSVLTRLNMSI